MEVIKIMLQKDVGKAMANLVSLKILEVTNKDIRKIDDNVKELAKKIWVSAKKCSIKWKVHGIRKVTNN